MVHIMSLQEAVQHFQQYMTNKSIATRLGVSQGQLMKYASGKTVSCNDSVVDNFYDHFSLDGIPILIDYFPDEQTYLDTRRARNE